MKALLSSLLVGALLVLAAPDAAAQRIAASRYDGAHRGGYVSSRVWIAGHYETVREQVWVPGPWQRVWVEPVHRWRLGRCGFEYVCVSAGYWRSVQLPGHYEERCTQVWRPGRWNARGGCN